MANEPEKKKEENPKAEAKPKAGEPAPLVLIGVIVAALAAGAAAGGFVIAPRIAPKSTAATAAHAAPQKSGKHGEAGKARVHRIENLIVNPAGSQGTRFLMTTVAIEVSDEKSGDILRDHDAQVRDIVIATLEGQTLEMLTKPGSREGLKRKLEAAIKPLVPESPEIRVFLPQFVIQ